MGLAALALLVPFLGSASVDPVRAQLDSAVEDRVAAATVLVVALVVTVEDGITTGEYWREPLGSGVLVSHDGLVLTNSHVIDLTSLQSNVDTEENAQGINLEIEDKYLIYVVDGLDDDPDPRYTAEVVLNRERLDLAVLEITGDEDSSDLRREVGEDRPPVEVGEPGTVRTRDLVHIFGYPVFGFQTRAIGATTIDTVDGRVRSLERGPGLGNLTRILVDVQLTAGSSGGAVVDEGGRLVGIVTEARGGDVGGSVAAVIPIDRALTVLNESGWTRPSPTPEPGPTSEPSSFPPANQTATPSPTATAEPTPTDTPTPTATATQEPITSPTPSAVADSGDAAHTCEQPGPEPADLLRVRWRFPIGAEVDDRTSSPAVLGGMVYVVGGSNDERLLYAIDARTGVEAWRFEVMGGIASSPTVANDAVYIGSLQGTVHALNAATGEERWNFPVPDGAAVRSSPAAADGLVYIGGLFGTLYAVDATTGNQQWELPTRSITSSITVSGDLVSFAASENTVYAIDVRSRDVLWVYDEADGPVTFAPAVSGGLVFVGSRDGDVHAIDAASGDRRWRFETGEPVAGSPIASDGVVYVGSRDGVVYAVDAETGTRLWCFQTGNDVLGSPAVADGVVHVGSSDGYLYAIDGGSGRELWHVLIDGVESSSPAAADGVVYVVSKDGYLYAIGGEG